MPSLLIILACILGGLVGYRLLFYNLPYAIHLARIARKYGTVKEKRKKLIKLFAEGKLTVVAWANANAKPPDKRSIVIGGPWGQYVKSGFYNDYVDEASSVQPPPDVLDAVAGYTDMIEDLFHLICYVPFLTELQKQVPDICVSDVLTYEIFGIYHKDCPYVANVEPDSPLRDTMVFVNQ